MNTLNTNSPAPVSMPSVSSILSKVARPLPRTTQVLCAGIGVATVASLLPWVTATDTELGESWTRTPGDAGFLAYILAAAAASVWVAWPVFSSTLSKARCAGLTVAVLFLSLFPVATFAGLQQHAQAAAKVATDSTDIFAVTDATTYAPALGLLVYCAGCIALWFGVISVWRGAFARRITSCPFPPPQNPAVSFGG